MNTIELKNSFHNLIDSINNDALLMRFYDIISQIKNSREGELWNKLSKEDQEDLLLSAKESENEENLISHEEMKKKHKRWL